MARKRLQACMERISSISNGVFRIEFGIQVCIHGSPTKVRFKIKINIFIIINIIKLSSWTGVFCLFFKSSKSYSINGN